MVLEMPSSRNSSVSVIGAISERQGLIHYHIVKGTNNTESFKNFIGELVTKI